MAVRYLLTVCVLLSLLATMVYGNCFTCASPELRQQWQLTGYPFTLADSAFTSACDDPTTLNSDTAMPCSTSCVEMLIPIFTRYVVLRGCLQTLLGEYYSNVTGSNNQVDSCQYGQLNRTTTNYYTGMTAVSKQMNVSYTAIRYCKSTSTDECNGQINVDTMMKGWVDAAPPDAQKNGITGYLENGGLAANAAGPKPFSCIPGTGLTCRKCTQINGEGRCDKHSEASCSDGQYCVKITGNQGGLFFEQRGCSAVNPYGGKGAQGCARISFNMPMQTGAFKAPSALAPIRQKRDLQLTYNALQCYCDSAYCNSSPGMKTKAAMIILSLFTAFWVLR